MPRKRRLSRGDLVTSDTKMGLLLFPAPGSMDLNKPSYVLNKDLGVGCVVCCDMNDLFVLVMFHSRLWFAAEGDLKKL